MFEAINTALLKGIEKNILNEKNCEMVIKNLMTKNIFNRSKLF